MKKIAIITAIFLLGMISIQSYSQELSKIQQSQLTSDTKVQVYYFHGDRRCETCKAVGFVSKGVVDKDFAGQENVEFIEVNYDQEENKALAEKFKVASSSLLVFNQKETVDLTTYAFQYAKSEPTKLKQKLRETIKESLR